MRYLMLVFACLISCVEASTVLITGASRGIGLETAKAFQQAGWSVWGASRTMPQNDPSLDGIHFRIMDVTDDQAVAAVIAEIIKTDGQIDILVNNAGYGVLGAIESISLDEMRQQFEVNFFGVVRVTQAVLPHMRAANQGRIINISSTSGIRAIASVSVYAASKFALEALTEGLAAETSFWNIKVISVEPGPVVTDFVSATTAGSKKTGVDEYERLNRNFQQFLDDRLSVGQKPEEIGHLIFNVATTANPNLRYTTDEDGLAISAAKWVDPTGNSGHAAALHYLNLLMNYQ